MNTWLFLARLFFYIQLDILLIKLLIWFINNLDLRYLRAKNIRIFFFLIKRNQIFLLSLLSKIQIIDKDQIFYKLFWIANSINFFLMFFK